MCLKEEKTFTTQMEGKPFKDVYIELLISSYDFMRFLISILFSFGLRCFFVIFI